MRQWTVWALIQIIACRPDGAKPLSKPMLKNRQLDPKKHISMKIYLKFNYFHSRKCAWTCCLRNGGHFVQGKMSAGSSSYNSQTYPVRFQLPPHSNTSVWIAEHRWGACWWRLDPETVSERYDYSMNCWNFLWNTTMGNLSAIQYTTYFQFKRHTWLNFSIITRMNCVSKIILWIQYS